MFSMSQIGGLGNANGNHNSITTGAGGVHGWLMDENDNATGGMTQQQQLQQQQLALTAGGRGQVVALYISSAMLNADCPALRYVAYCLFCRH
jgi:hypothetical protein